jgi:glyoxylate reductase
MTASTPRVVVTRRLPEPVEARLCELFDVRLSASDAPPSEEALRAAVAEADVLVPSMGDRIDAALIAAAPRLKLIANFGPDVEHIDVAAAHARDIVVTNTPGVLTDDVADLTMALVIGAPRRLTEGVRALVRGEHAGDWSPAWMLGRRISGSTIGIVGMGRIGQAVARRARGFGMSVHYHDRGPIAPALADALEATYHERLSSMLMLADVVSVHCARTPATYHLLCRRRLEQLQPHACVINTSRGDVIDEEALADLLEAGRLGGAALDVFEHERPNPRLATLPNVLLTPHMASATVEARLEMGEKVIVNIRVWRDGERPPDRVPPEWAEATWA